MARINRTSGWRLAFGALWLAFAIWTLSAAKSPGFVPQPELAPYPWVGVFVTWILLAVETAGLYGLLRPVSFRDSWGRLGLALAVMIGLLFFPFPYFVTDMPGYYYMPGLFALLSTAGLLVVGLAMVVSALVRHWRTRAA